MKLMRISILAIVALGFATACHKNSTTSSPAPAAVKPAAAASIQGQIQGRWIETAESYAGVGSKTDEKGYYSEPSDGPISAVPEARFLTIDEKQFHFSTFDNQGMSLGSIDHNYKIDGQNVSLEYEFTTPDFATIKTDGKTLILIYSDGYTKEYRKIDDVEYSKFQHTNKN